MTKGRYEDVYNMHTAEHINNKVTNGVDRLTTTEWNNNIDTTIDRR